MSIDEIIAGMTDGEKQCLLTWGLPDVTERAAVPDSIWHGRWSGFKHAVPTGYTLSPLGLAVRARLEEQSND